MNIAEDYSRRNEITLYYAAVATDRLSDKGNVIYSEYIFQTEQEAIESGLEYSIATWEDINMFADCGYTYSGVIICTPQGRFVFHEIYMNEEEIEWNIPSKCVYRAYGSSERFSENVEDHLFWNKGCALIGIIEESGGFRAEIMNVGGEVIIIDG
ncbi:hypothetical protein [Paenibacillus donghaensis]|uniref:Uncharacterized protein n=1 Tax=Paenibacillus donghaensis TaxID=414771 RepID=A0A2Z2KK49_9BACL|nr:hypothetical protein [Paenibacillus donghaensis]ASA22719.1 hypothetical protein B9T62_19120 [Paenibacillus donghaensis]